MTHTPSAITHRPNYSTSSVMASIVWRHTAPTAPNRQTHCCRKSSTLPYRPEINLYASYHALHDETTI